jgi:transcription initiation factor TFIIIB Brf1 subunit/transcription initiation factor TFIIB
MIRAREMQRKAMAETTTKAKCEHRRTRLIAKDNEAQYVECVDCGEILETGEMKEAPGQPASPQKTAADAPTTGYDESLSDA